MLQWFSSSGTEQITVACYPEGKTEARGRDLNANSTIRQNSSPGPEFEQKPGNPASQTYTLPTWPLRPLPARPRPQLVPLTPSPPGPILHLLCPPAGVSEGYTSWRRLTWDEGVSGEAIVLFRPGI